VFDRLDADLAHAMMCINAVKAVEVGDGFPERRAARLRASRRAHSGRVFLSNQVGRHAWRHLVSGQDIVVSMATEADFEHRHSRAVRST
jgi:chorismate synthase